MFKCPECNSTTLHEHEIGPIITREVRGINSHHHCTVYDDHWQSVGSKKWWTCANCGWKLPVGNTDELIAYLEDSIPHNGRFFG